MNNFLSRQQPTLPFLYERVEDEERTAALLNREVQPHQMDAERTDGSMWLRAPLHHGNRLALGGLLARGLPCPMRLSRRPGWRQLARDGRPAPREQTPSPVSASIACSRRAWRPVQRLSWPLQAVVPVCPPRWRPASAARVQWVLRARMRRGRGAQPGSGC